MWVQNRKGFPQAIPCPDGLARFCSGFSGSCRRSQMGQGHVRSVQSIPWTVQGSRVPGSKCSEPVLACALFTQARCPASILCVRASGSSQATYAFSVNLSVVCSFQTLVWIRAVRTWRPQRSDADLLAGQASRTGLRAHSAHCSAQDCVTAVLAVRLLTRPLAVDSMSLRLVRQNDPSDFFLVC